MAKQTRGYAGFVDTRFRYGSFIERYPDYPSWLDGAVWEIDVAEDLKESLNNFRSSLHYQAKALGLELRTKKIKREDREYLLVQAVEPNTQ